MGKMGDTWRGVETNTKTGETDQGVTKNPRLSTAVCRNGLVKANPTSVIGMLKRVSCLSAGLHAGLGDAAAGRQAGRAVISRSTRC
jgi:hypothetical protein